MSPWINFFIIKSYPWLPYYCGNCSYHSLLN